MSEENKKKEILKKITEEQKKLDSAISDMFPILEHIENTLKKVNDISGATQRADNIREEIKVKGWDTITKIYHPNNNTKDPTAVPLWEFYKYVYEDMKRKGEI